MMQKKFKNLLLLFFLFAFSFSVKAATLPKNIQWTTAEYQPILSSGKAKKGGTYRTYLQSYPLTFRLYGPNSNAGSFVSFNRKYAFWSLVTRHPNTSEFLPELATHWFIAKDKKTAYFKLDKKARWSDGKIITADDYVFAFDFLQSPYIQAPFYNQYIRDHIAAVEKIDDFTLKIVSVKPSWRLLETVSISPLPKHNIKLDKDWVKKSQWKPNVVPGPYVLKEFKKNQYIIFERVQDWWGKDRPQYKHQFNFDKIRLDIIRNESIAYESFKKNKLSVFSPTEIQWFKETDIDIIKKGYVLKNQHSIDTWTGLRGILFHTQDAVWSDARLRQAVGYSIDFPTINKNHLYSLNERKHNFFDVDPPYKAKRKTYDFNLKKSAELLSASGWKISSKDGFRYKDGKKLVLRLFYASASHNHYLGTIKNGLKRVGIDLELVLQDGATFYRTIETGKYQALLLFFGAGRYPAPRQFLHTENKKLGTNNLFLFGNEKLDKLIDTYEYDLNEQNRINAIEEIEEIAHNNALLVHFWKKPVQLFLRWRYIQAPPHLGTRRGIDFDLLWYDEEIAKKVEDDKKKGKSFSSSK